jgi:hypothetical protein
MEDLLHVSASSVSDERYMSNFDSRIPPPGVDRLDVVGRLTSSMK